MLPAFFDSVLDLIVKTSTDLPPDVRAAMGLAVKKGLLKGTEEEQAAMLEKAAELVMNRLTK